MFLFIVEGAFQISGWGLALVPELGKLAETVRIGVRIRLIRPDKTELLTQIAGITMNVNATILLPKEISKEDVPIGTEVCLEEVVH